jgi:hypothetical protein
MARKIIVQINCDVCGSEVADGSPVEFVFQGVGYRSDLCRTHAAALDAALRPFVDVAERVGRHAASDGSTGGRRGVAPTRRDPEHVAAIRAWARANGFDISSRGRIPHNVEAAYNERAK